MLYVGLGSIGGGGSGKMMLTMVDGKDVVCLFVYLIGRKDVEKVQAGIRQVWSKQQHAFLHRGPVSPVVNYSVHKC